MRDAAMDEGHIPLPVLVLFRLHLCSIAAFRVGKIGTGIYMQQCPAHTDLTQVRQRHSALDPARQQGVDETRLKSAQQWR